MGEHITTAEQVSDRVCFSQNFCLKSFFQAVNTTDLVQNNYHISVVEFSDFTVADFTQTCRKSDIGDKFKFCKDAGHIFLILQLHLKDTALVVVCKDRSQ